MNLNLIKRQDLATKLGIGTRTLRNWQDKGLKPYKVGKHVYYDLTEVERFMKEAK